MRLTVLSLTNKRGFHASRWQGFQMIIRIYETDLNRLGKVSHWCISRLFPLYFFTYMNINHIRLKFCDKRSFGSCLSSVLQKWMKETLLCWWWLEWLNGRSRIFGLAIWAKMTLKILDGFGLARSHRKLKMYKIACDVGILYQYFTFVHVKSSFFMISSLITLITVYL